MDHMKVKSLFVSNQTLDTSVVVILYSLILSLILGYSPGNWNYFSLYYDYSYVPYGVWFIVYPPNSNGVMVNIGNYYCRLLSGIRP